MSLRALALLAAALLLAAAAPGATAPDTPGAALRALALERSGGDLGQLGVMITHGPDGPIERTISGEEFLALAAVAGERLARPQTENLVHSSAVGFGYHQPHLAARLGWPFCDYASFFAMYFGPPGSAIAHADRSPTGDIATQPVCGGFYGVTHTWSDITFDIRGLPGAWMCASALVGINVELPSTTPSAPCNVVGCISGNAALTSLSFFGIALDYALGNGNMVVIGHDRTEFPTCGPMPMPEAVIG